MLSSCSNYCLLAFYSKPNLTSSLSILRSTSCCRSVNALFVVPPGWLGPSKRPFTKRVLFNLLTDAPIFLSISSCTSLKKASVSFVFLCDSYSKHLNCSFNFASWSLVTQSIVSYETCVLSTLRVKFSSKRLMISFCYDIVD